MKKAFIFIFILFLALLGVFFISYNRESGLISPLSGSIKRTLPLEKYSFSFLKTREFEGSEIVLEKKIKEEEKYTSWVFSYLSDEKKVTGMINIPKGKGPFPVIVMIRGYADDDIYFTGLGTRKAAGVFAENGFLTLAPDFLGFGGSDELSANILEARFEKPITVLSLLESINSLEEADKDDLFLWGHSNGGQIAISVLEISGKEIPTVLWAPVVKGFPESVLYYMKELDDQGKKVKRAIDKFVRDYDEENYSIEAFMSSLKAPIQLHYGTYDSLIPIEWIDDFRDQLESQGNKPIYFEYNKDNHNLKDNWDEVVERDLKFFKSFL